MDFYSFWPPIIILAALFALSATPLFKAADSPPIPAGNRIATLDGLRGFLALSVFFHHAAIFHTYAQGVTWAPPPDRFYALLGPYGVAMFFMITGFLFWGQLIDRGGKPGWVKLYVGRIFRLGPLYLAAIIAVTLAALGATGFHLLQSPARVVFEFVEWAAPLGIRMGPPIDGYAHSRELISVIWSLRYEWIFYISLIATGVFTRTVLGSIAFPTATLLASLLLIEFPLVHRLAAEAPFVALFSVGMITASLRTRVPDHLMTTPAASVVAALLLLAVLCLFDTAYTVAPLCMLGVAFFLIANGASLFGLLNTRPARRLGNVSYGLYLLQLLVLSGVFAFGPTRQLALGVPLGHWTVIAGAGLLLVIIATAAHALIERPGIDIGRRLVQRIAPPRPPVATAGS